MNGGAWRHISKDEYDHLKARGETGLDWIEGIGHVVYDRQAFEEFRSASDRIAASVRGKASAVMVKPLEWDAHGRADVYSVVKDDLRSPPDFFMARGDKIIGHYSDETEAKAAAQADYEARIRSALVEAPAVKGEPETGRVSVPEGQTPLDDKLGHRYLDVIKEGATARDTGSGSPYHGHSLEHCLHAAGWVSRDLRIALDKAKAAPPADAGMREALAAVTVDLISTADKDEDPFEWASVKQSYAALGMALTAPGATTKSDGGGEGHAETWTVRVTDERDTDYNDAPVREVLMPNGEWRKCIAVDDADARKTMQDEWAEEVKATAPGPSDPSSTRSEVTFKFDRYINGELMAEGVTIERQPDLVSAMRSASKIAARGPSGEAPVLVLASREDDITISDALQPLDDVYVNGDGFCNWADVATARDEVRALLDQFQIRRK